MNFSVNPCIVNQKQSIKVTLHENVNAAFITVTNKNYLNVEKQLYSNISDGPKRHFTTKFVTFKHGLCGFRIVNASF